MANIVKFNMKQIPQALSEIFVRVTDLNRNELYAGVKPVSGEEVEINLGNSGTVGAGVIIQADTFNGSNLTEFKSLSGGALVSEILSNISLSGYKFQSNGTDNYIDLGFVPDENTDMAFQVTYLDSTGKQISGSEEFGLGSSNGNLISSVNGVESTFDAVGTDTKSLGLLSSGLAYVDGLENGTEATVTGATLNLYAMAKNASSGVNEHCAAVWERISWYHNGEHHYIDFTEGSGSTVTDNFGNEYTIQGTVSDSQWINYAKARRVFIDTDMETDCDDVGALRVLTWAERLGYIDIVGLVVSNQTDGLNLAAPVDAVMTFGGRPNLAIGVNHAATVIPGGSSYNSTVLGYPHTLADDALVEDSTTTYRRAFQSAIDDGVKLDLVVLGTLRALKNFMLSPASDGYPSGMDMINLAVERYVGVGGVYPSGSEFNFDANNEVGRATQYVLANFPKEMFFTGVAVGNQVVSGGNLKDVFPTLGVDIMRDAYFAHGSEDGRRSWDPMCAYFAALNNPSQMGQKFIRGTNTASSTGANTFTESPVGNHYYAVNLKGSTYYVDALNDVFAGWDAPTRDDLGLYSIPRLSTVLSIENSELTQGVEKAGDTVTTFSLIDNEVSNVSVDFTQGTNIEGLYQIQGNVIQLTQEGENFLSVGGNKLLDISLTSSTGKTAVGRVLTIGTGTFARYYTTITDEYMVLNRPLTLGRECSVRIRAYNVSEQSLFIGGDGGDSFRLDFAGGQIRAFIDGLSSSTGAKITPAETDVMDILFTRNLDNLITLTVNGVTETRTWSDYDINITNVGSSVGYTSGSFTADVIEITGVTNEDRNVAQPDALFYLDENGVGNGYTYYDYYDSSLYFTGTAITPADVSQTL
ncbi:hypothetical protein [Pseudoalteromonas sp. SR43-5]|uniref:hypothetical protein n=1 Tax=Pseudoalteromonas sp. SR43-5 TaxID=2760941 RepID=UPI0015FA4492|nr:hypothetical protein [Pseudoalteromonas sp. SR43-5]MBB1307303.1 hypothetical protein [Pseudoalteromonas sp. SR43-5]